MTRDLADALVPIAAELVGTVRDYGPDDVAEVLARVPDGRLDALAVVLAAMVDPDRSPAELLAWTEVRIPARPARPSRRQPREHGSLRGYRQHSPGDPACGPCRSAHAADRAARREAAASTSNVPTPVIAERIGIQGRQVWRLKARDTAPHRKTNRPAPASATNLQEAS